jgi:hypothetical protein
MKKCIKFCFAALFLLSSCHASDTGRSEQAASIISKHVIRFTQPGKRIPSQFSVHAPLLGNGFTGIALAGNPEQQVFYAARNDFWRLKSACYETFPLVLGKIELSIPQLKDASFLIEQQLYSATTTARFQKGDLTVTYKTYLSAADDILIVELAMQGKGSVNGSVLLSLPGEKEILNKPPLELAFPGKMERNTTDTGIQTISRAFDESVDIPTKAAAALRMENLPDNNGSFSLEEGKPVRFICAFSSNFKSKDCVAAAVQKVTGCDFNKLSEIEDTHKKWWKDYWEKSFVSIPDAEIERQYYVSLYGTACASRDKDFPPPIFGTWITQEHPGWGGDYHLNYNHMAPYYALYSANRIEQAEPYYTPVLAFVDRGHYYSEKVTKIPEGILFPVGIGPLGIDTSRWSELMEKHRKSWKDAGNVEDDGVFWGQKSNSAYAVVNLSMQFYHTYDKEFTKKVYPFVRDVAHFWENYLKFEDGRYVIYNDAVHEGSIGTKNAILSLGLVHLVMQTVRDMSILLDVDKDKREKWSHIDANLSKYPLQERNGKTVFRLSEEGLAWYNYNTLGIQHIYPAGQIGLDSDPKLREIAVNTINEKQRWIDSNGSNSFFPAAVRVGYDPDSILHHLRRYSQHACPNGFQLDNPHGIENWSTVPNTINEMLCMGHQDVVRLFPVWPRDKDASFSQIRVEGAFLVSAALKNGEVTDVSIFSEKGRPLHLLNPWKNRKVEVKAEDADAQTYESERITISTKPGVTYRISPVKQEIGKSNGILLQNPDDN